MTTLSDAAEILSPPRSAVERQKWRHFAAAMRAVRDKLIAPTYEASIQDIEKALGCSRRTAERIYAGESVGTEPHFAALTHPEHGAAYLETVLRNVAPERRAKLSEELMNAAKLVWLEEEQLATIKKVRR
jgi:hypothetical protein